MKAIRFTKSREAFQQEHKGELKLFYLAGRTLKKACPDGKLLHRPLTALAERVHKLGCSVILSELKLAISAGR